MQILAKDRTVDGNRARHHVEQVDGAIAGREIAATGTESHVAAVEGYAVRVGDDDVGAATEYFRQAVQRAAAAAGDFIENDACRAGAVEIGIAWGYAAELGGADLAVVVVEDQAGRA